MQRKAIIVIDIGKTLAKASLWDASGALVERRTRPNGRLEAEHYAALDVTGIEAWLADSLAAFASIAEIGSIIPVGHGAGAAIVRGGSLACPPADYEAPIPAHIRSAYDALRDPFSQTGSPTLPDGLNLGAQLFWIGSLYPGIFDGSVILPWAQYWSWLLSGVAASEVTSLGCHTDLWNPGAAHLSEMVRTMGWEDCFAPLRRAGDVLGPITLGWASRTGLPADTQIHCGIHDSNAALMAARGFGEIAEHESTVLSTGTWFVAMRSPARPLDLAGLPELRDCLVNVDAFGKSVPSARFMGGREIETLIDLDTRRIDIKPDQPALLSAVPGILATGAMVLPTFAQGFGPFPHGRGRWVDMPNDWHARRAAVCLYAALVVDTSLDLIGASERILVEGRFAEAEVFVRALASLRPGTEIYTSYAHNDVSFGALRLLNPDFKPAMSLNRVAPLDFDLSGYRARWQRECQRREAAS